MAEPIKLEITVDDKGTPVIQQFKETLDSVPLSATQASKVFGDLGISEEQLREASSQSAQAIGTLASQLIQGTNASATTAAAVRQVENALAGFTARADVAGENERKLQAALDAGELAFRKLALTSGQQAPEAMQRFAASIQEAQERLNTLSDGALRKTQDEATRAQASLDRIRTALGPLKESSDAFETSLGSTIKTLGVLSVGVGSVYGAFNLLRNGIETAVSQAGDFEASMNNVYTLGIKSADAQERLREQVLKLNPVLGSSTELAKGLYEVLSTGIEPAKSVAFLETSARLAKAGLADLDTSIIALTKTMENYKVPTEQAAEVSEILFKAVVIGQGHLQDFARAFPVVTQLSSNLGVSLKDTAAVLSTLSLSFKSTQEGATAFRSLLNDLVEHSAKFAAAGLNIRDALEKGGILEVVNRLRELTHGNAEALREYIGDVRAVNAALALMGSSYDTLLRAQGEFQKQTDEVGDALQQQAKGMKASWDAFKNSLDRTVHETAPPVLDFLTDFINSMTDAGQAQRKHAETSEQAAHWDTEFLKAERAKEQGIREAARALDDEVVALSQYQVQTKEATEAQKLFEIALRAERQAVKELDGDLGAFNELLKTFSQHGRDGVKLLDTDKIAREADNAIAILERLRDSGKVSFEAIQQSAEKMADGIVAKLGYLPPKWAEVLAEMRERTEDETNALANAWERFGIQSRGVMQQFVQNDLDAFREILESGEATPKKLLDIWKNILKQITESGFDTLPPGFEAINAQMQDIARKAGVALPEPYRNAFNEIVVDAQKAAQAIDTSFLETRGALERAAEGAHHVARAMKEAEAATNEYGNALARTSAETEKLNRLQASFEQSFGSDIPTLLKQLQQAQHELMNVPFMSETGAPGFRDFTASALKQEIELIKQKLLGLGFDAGSIGANPNNPTRIGATSGDAVGGATSTAMQTIVSQAASIGGGSSSFMLSPEAQAWDKQYIHHATSEERINPDWLRDAIQESQSRIDAQTALHNQAGVEALRADLAEMIDALNKIASGGAVAPPQVTVNVNAGLVAQRIDQQAIVSALAPAINEAIRRGQVVLR